jgi:hypothetical protein
MADADVDLVATCMDFNGVTTLQQEMRRQGLEAPQYLPNGYDYDFLAESGDLFTGSYVLTQFTPFEMEDPPEGLTTYLEWIESTGGTVGELSLAGWVSADMLVTGLRAAGPEFSQQAVIDGLNSLSDYDARGILPDLDWTVEHEAEGAQQCSSLLRIDGDEFVPEFGEPGRPFVCFETDATEVVDPVVSD